MTALARSSFLPVACACTLLCCGASPAEAIQVYWTVPSGHSISRVDADGGSAEFVAISPSGDPIGIDFDVPNQKMYWIASNINGLDRIFRSAIDGSPIAETETLVTALHGLGADIALDLDAGKLYWCAWAGQFPTGGGIYRCNLDGTGEETIVTGLERPTRLVLHPELEVIYWTDSANWLIQSASTTGTNVGVATLIPFPISPEGLAIDFDAGFIYWSEFNTGAIKRASLGGQGVDTVTLVSEADGAGPPRDLGVDFDSGTMYWTDPVHAKIRSANLLGDGVSSLTTASSCVGLALRFAPEPAPCNGDLSGDGSVEGTDIAMILGNWGTIGESAFDLNGDGAVDGSDLAIVLGSWGTCR